MRRLSLALLVAACSPDPITEVVLSIDQVGISIGRDIDTIHIDIGHDKFTPDSFLSIGVALCEALPTSGCKNLPLTATLIPGGTMPTDIVRAEVDAKLHGDGDNAVTRIREVANFHFSKGQSLRLELVLTPNCLDDPLRCSEAELACGPMGCYNAVPEPAGADLGVVLDLATPPDLAGVDFKGVDLACSPSCPAGYCGLDKNGCRVSCTCDPNSFLTCGGGMMCVSCGADNQSCCPPAPRCKSSGFACDAPDVSGKCVPCAAQGNSCTASGQPCCAGSVCDVGGSCVRCGQQLGDPCCAGDPSCGSGLTCLNGHCQTCGTSGITCCHDNPDPNPCESGTACVNGAPPGGGGGNDYCQACGNSSQPCCNGACNNMPAIGCNSMNTCAVCGHPAGAACCGGFGCNSGLDCDTTNLCQPCGMTAGDPCCSDSSCSGGLICTGPTCQSPPDMFGPRDMAQPRDMTPPNDMLSSGICGDHNQLCCVPPPPSNPPCHDGTLACVSGSCRCGLIVMPGNKCCTDDVDPYCVARGTFCDPNSSTCTVADMGGAVVTPCIPNMGLLFDDCCLGGTDGLCAANFACCAKPSCAGMAGSVGMHTCYQ